MRDHLSRAIAVALGLLALGACEPDPDTYPISGEPCGPGDPVQEVDVITCVPGP